MPTSEGVKHPHDLAPALMVGGSAALCIERVHAVHPCFRSTLPVWMWLRFTPCVCPDHKIKRSLHYWDAGCIEALELRWSLVLSAVSGSKETQAASPVQARHSDLSCAVSGWRYLETQCILNSLFEATQCLSQYLKPQMSGSHPRIKL